MKNYDKKITLRLSDDNYKKLENIKKISNSSLNLIVNMIIDNYQKDMENKKIYFNDSNLRKDKMVHLRLTQKEYDFLHKESKIHGFNSATKEVKFRLVSSMYNENFFTPIEMNELTPALNSMRKLGANIVTLIKAIYAKNSNITFNFDNVEKTCELVKNYIENTSKLIQKYCDILDKRI